MSGQPARLGAVLAAALCAVALSTGPAHAQTLGKTLTRSFNQCTVPAQYVFGYDFFTATGPEAMLTFSRTHVACSEVCQTIPPNNSCGVFCGATDPCPNNWKCSCSGPTCLGHCVHGVDVLVGYAIVLKSSRFCSIVACSALRPVQCASATCDGSGTCADGTSNAKSLCLCADPACPNGQQLCDSQRPTLPASDVAFEAFDATTNPSWVLGLASISGNVLQLNGTATPTSLAEARFATVPGEDYVVLVKWTISPIISDFQSCPDASLLLSVETRPDSCGP